MFPSINNSRKETDMFRKIIIMLVAMLLVVSNVGFAQENISKEYYMPFTLEQYKRNSNIPICLKIDKHYILYTKPYGPYIDTKGNMIISAQMVKHLLGGSYSYDQKSKKASIELYGTKIDFTIDSNKVLVDGKQKEMKVPARAYEDGVLIPLRVILDNTDIKHVYVESRKQLHITDERVTIKDFFRNTEAESYAAQSKDNNAITLVSYTPIGGGKTKFTGINESGETIAKGASEIRYQGIFLNKDGSDLGFFESDNYSRGSLESLPQVEVAGTISRTMNYGKYSIDTTYVTAIGRLMPVTKTLDSGLYARRGTYNEQ